MTSPERDAEMRELAREVLRELVPGLLHEAIAAAPAHAGGNGNSAAHTNGNGITYTGANGVGNRDTSRNGGTASRHTGGHQDRAQASDREPTPVPLVPAPPVAAVLRPSTWDRPPAPGEIIGHPSARTNVPGPGAGPRVPQPAPGPGAEPRVPQPAPGPSALPRAAESDRTLTGPSRDARVEVVVLDTDEDLMRFVRQLMSRLEHPRERLAVRTGRLRFALRRSPPTAASPTAPPGPVTRVEKGAVTERMVRAAAAEGARLVLAPGTVLTPLAREQANALGVEIERERRC